MMRLLHAILINVILGAVVIFAMPISAFSVVHQISIGDDFFAPLNSSINPGDTVRWTNLGIRTHTTTSNTRIWSSGPLAPSATYQRQFLTPGVYPYQCSIHVAFGMRDTIRVASTGVNDPLSSMPKDYGLAQNYPNPFNAQTTIQYDLPSGAEVSISVFDILGRKIETLVNEHQDAGNHQVVWNAADSPSGFYFYRIQAGEFIQTKRATLLK
jgi:plastocyanin